MPAPNSAPPRALLIQVMDTARILLDRARAAFSISRWALLLIGVGCIAYGQNLIEQRVIQGKPLYWAELWNITFRLEVENLDNVLYALPYFAVGGILCALTAMPSAWKRPFVNWAGRWPIREEAQGSLQRARILTGIISLVFLLIQLGRHQYAPFYPLLWLMAIVVSTQIFWRWDHNAAIDLSLGIKPIDLFWISTLLALGVGIGSFALQDIPISIVPDEALFWEAAYKIAGGDMRPAFFDAGVYTFPVASSILQSRLMHIFGINLWGWRFTSVIAGVAAAVPLYLLTKEWFGRYAAVAAGIMMLANPYFLAFSRLGYNNSQSLFPVTLCIYFFALGARKGSYFYLWLAGVAAAFGFYTYFAAWIGMMTLVLGIFYSLAWRQIHWKRALTALSLMSAAWIMVVAPRIAYTTSGAFSEKLVYKIFEASFVNIFYGRAYYGEADLVRTMPAIHIGEYHTLFFDPLIYSELLQRGTVRTILALFDPFVVQEHFLVTGLTGVITPVFFVIGLVICLRYRKQLRFGMPLIWLISSLVFLSILNSFPPRHTHLVAVIPGMALISGAGLAALSESLSEQLSSRWASLRSTFNIVVVLVTCAAIGYFGFQRYFVAMPKAYPPLFEEVAAWVAWRNAEPVNVIYLGRTDRANYGQYLVNLRLAPHLFAVIPVSAFDPEKVPIAYNPTIIFIEGGMNGGLPWLDKPPAGFSDPVAYFYPDGHIIGYALTNTTANLRPRAGLEDGLSSLTIPPVRYVLLSLIVLSMVAGIWHWRAALKKPGEELILEAENIG